MIEPDVTPYPGVHRRADANTYQFGLRVPKDLRDQFPGPWAVRCSLGTSSLREANDKAKAMQAEWALKFEAIRSGKQVPVDLPALRSDLLTRIETIAAGVDGSAASWDRAEREERAMALSWELDAARQAVAGGSLWAYQEEWLHQVLKHRSSAADAEAMAALVDILEIRLEAITDETRTFPQRVAKLRARRELAATTLSALPTTALGRAIPQASGYRIGNALEVWRTDRKRPQKTVDAFTRHAGQFTSMMGDPVLSTIDRTKAFQFKDALQAWAVANGKTASTADNVLVSIRALAGVAHDRGWISSNPFMRLAVKVGGNVTEAREPWTGQELSRLFDDPIWAEYMLPTASKAGRAAAYWIPLIACYTGARVSEIAQLWTDDLCIDRGKEALEFRVKEGRGQSLKTRGSWRAVPMHSELIRLGLPDYTRSLPLGSLFPDLRKAGNNGAGGQFAGWFGDFKRAKGFASPSKTLHSFRHLVVTRLQRSGTNEALSNAITGHAGASVAQRTYGATIREEAEHLRSTIELLQFPELCNLPRVLR